MKFWILALTLISTPALAGEKPSSSQNIELKIRFDQAFKTIDSNGDGKISKAEADQKAPSLGVNFDAVDTNKDGFISKQEIWDAQQKMSEAMRQANENFSRILAKADKNNDGKLSKEETQTTPELAKLAKYFDQIDSNHDNVLVMKEIISFMQARVQAQVQAANNAPKQPITPSSGVSGK